MQLKTPRRKPRGYILLEAMAGAVILSVALVSVYHHAGTAQRQGAEQIRRAQAMAVLSSTMAEYRSRAANSGTITISNELIYGTATYGIRRSVNVSGYGGAANVNNYRTIIVEVTYFNANQRQQKLRAVSHLAPQM